MILALLLLLLTAPAFAAPPPGADPESPTAAWFRELRVPDTGGSCCSEADCRPVEWRMAGDGYEAFIDRASFGPGAPNAWQPVPAGHVLRRADNPVGRAVACWYGGAVLCFVPGGAT